MSAVKTDSALPPVASLGKDASTAKERVFRPGSLTVGLILPLETHPGSPWPTMKDHLAMAARAEAMGFSALWLRDVPFFDPRYGDAGQIYEPLVYIAALASATRSIALGTAGIVLPLREPKILAKQATSVDQLSGGRLLLGLSSGDRPAEYPLFDIDFDSRGERFQDAFQVLRTVSEQDFPAFESKRFGRSNGEFNLLPKPVGNRIAMLGIGRAQQGTDWLARNMDGLIVPAPMPDELSALAGDWAARVARLNGVGAHKPMGVAGFLDLVEDIDHPLEKIRGGFRTGRIALAHFLEAIAAAGIEHVALNPKISRRPYVELMSEMTEYVFPMVPSYVRGDQSSL